MTTSSLLTKVLGVAAIGSVALLLVLALFVVPADVQQGDYARLIYIHPATAWVTYTAFGVTAVASVLYLYRRTRSIFWDSLAGASAEIGVVFCALTLITGAIWGRPTWGVWWTWDARLTSTAVLLTLFLGYLALRRLPGEEHRRARRSAIAALIAVVDVPIVHFSVEWWRTLHQGRTLLRPDPTIEGIQLFTMLWSFLALSLFFGWLLVHRFRVERLERRYENEALDIALVERRNEATASTGRETAGANQ